MLDDTDGAKFNRVLVSIICDYIYQRDNERTSIEDCYDYVVRELGISTSKAHIKNVISKVDYITIERSHNQIFLFLQVETYDKLCHTSDLNSIEYHAKDYLKQAGMPMEKAEKLVSMIHQSIYENIQGLASTNVKRLLSEEAKGKFPSEEIVMFNEFLEYESTAKDNAIFKLFYKALEFAIATSGKGVQDFSENLFKGKIYLLDANVIFRMMGIDGIQERANIEELILACLHQGVNFRYTHQTYAELKRKREQAIALLKRFNNSLNPLVEETIIDGEIDIQEGFVNQYFRYKKVGVVSTPEQYELKLMAEFRQFEDIYKLEPTDRTVKIEQKDIDVFAQELFEEKRARKNRRYTSSASQVDAHNILYVRKARAINSFNFSDVKCFYLSTDWTLSEILKSQNQGQTINEILSPAQAFLLHTALSNNAKGADYITFTKFLKKNIVGQDLTGVEVVRYVNQISGLTTDPGIISNLLKAYSDKRYTSAKNYSTEFELPTFSEFAKTELDAQLDAAHQKADEAEREKDVEIERAQKRREEESEKSQAQIVLATNAQTVAIGERDTIAGTLNSTIQFGIKRHLRTSLRLAKTAEVVLGISVGITALLIKDRIHSYVLLAGICLIVLAALANLFFSSKLPLMSGLWRIIFLNKIRNSDMYHAESTRDTYFNTAVTEFEKVTSNNLWSVKLK